MVRIYQTVSPQAYNDMPLRIGGPRLPVAARPRTVLNDHPIQNGIYSPLLNDYRFTVAVGASLADSAIVLRLIARQVPARYPNIQDVIPHLGGPGSVFSSRTLVKHLKPTL